MEKNKKILFIIIGLVITIALGIGGYVVFNNQKLNNQVDKDQSSSKDENSSKEETDNPSTCEDCNNFTNKKLDAIMSSSYVNPDTYERMIAINNNESLTYDAGVMSQVSKFLKYEFIDFSYLNVENVNNLSNQSKLWLMYWLLKDDSKQLSIEDYYKEEILKEAKDYFGSNFTINFEDILLGENGVLYKFANNKYTQTDIGGMGADLILFEFLYLTGYKEENNKIYVTGNALFANTYTGNLVDNLSTSKAISELEMEEISDEDRYNSYMNYVNTLDLNETTFIFEKKDNDVYFIGIKK